MIKIAIVERNPAARAGVSMESHDSRRMRSANELEPDITEYSRRNSSPCRFDQQKRQQAADQSGRSGPRREIPQFSEAEPVEIQVNSVSHKDPDILRIRK
jgi:hypothetical protein